MIKDDNRYLYFFYSSEYENMRNEAEGKLGLRFVSGTVVDSGTKKKFSYMSTDKNFMRTYPDAILVSEGYERSIKYIDTTVKFKRGN